MKNLISRSAAILVAGLVVTPVAEAQVDGSRCSEGGSRALWACRNSTLSEPLVIWDVTGQNMAGLAVHGTLVVYNSGVASVASLNTGDVRTAVVGSQNARALRGRLVEAGALALCDGGYATDMPLTTVTVLGGQPEARANSFSYWIAVNQYARVQAEIDDFLAHHFQGFSLY